MDRKDEIKTSLSYSLAGKIQYILVVRLFAKKVERNKEKHTDRCGNSDLSYFSTKRRPQHDFHRQFFL